MESKTLDLSAQTSGGVAPTRPDRLLFLAGVLQIVATFTPAARLRIVGGLSFVRLPNAGVTLVILGLLTLAIALRPNRWWRFIPSILSAVILVVVYFRLQRNPSHTFVDPLLRHLLHPSWGFWPMGAAVFFSLVAAARVRPRRRLSDRVTDLPVDGLSGL